MEKATTMNKTQTFEFLKQVISTAEFKSRAEQTRILTIIEENFAPKAGGGQVQNPSYYDENLGSQMYYCRYLAQYCTEDEIVLSNGKSKGYSKSAIARWTKAGKEAKTLQEKALKMLLAGQQVEGQDLNAQAEELLVKRNKPEFYEDLRN